MLATITVLAFPPNESYKQTKNISKLKILAFSSRLVSFWDLNVGSCRFTLNAI
jgi:hypothetical protein